MEEKQTGIVTGGRLNLREHPTTQSKPLALIPDGAQITVSNHDAPWHESNRANLFLHASFRLFHPCKAIKKEYALHHSARSYRMRVL